MSRLSPQHHVPLHLMDERMTDRRIYMPRRFSAATLNAIRNADNLANGELRRYGYECKRVMLVFVDDHENPDRIAAVTFSLSRSLTLTALVDAKGGLCEKTLHAVDTTARLKQSFMYELVGVPTPSANDVDAERYQTKVYARNRSCY